VGHSEAVKLNDIAENISQKSAALLALDEALQGGLARVGRRRARMIELRFFEGLSMEKTAEVLSISPESVRRDSKLSRAWLNRQLQS
jgi:DNA-directed RNA polymerase specialized sigma24 family protein